MEKKVIEVADQKTADAFKALGIDAIVKGAAAPADTADVTLLKGEVDTLKKAVEAKDLEIETLKKGGSSEGDELTKAHVDTLMGAVATISKSMLETVNSLSGAVDTLQKSVTEKLEAIESEVNTIGTADVGRRTIDKSAPLKKAFEVDEKTGKKVLSKSKHAKSIIGVLDGLADNAETAGMYGDATVRFETSRQLTKSVIADLFENHDIQIID